MTPRYWMAFDVDDTLGEFAVACYSVLNRVYNRDLSPEGNLNYRIQDQYGISTTQFFSDMERHHVLDHVQPVPGVAAALTTLQQHGIGIQIVTARAYLSGGSPHGWRVTDAWMNRHGIPYTSLTVVYPRDAKVEWLFPGVVALFEDNYEHAASCPGMPQGVLVNRPWNAGYTYGGRRCDPKDLASEILAVAAPYL